MLAPHVADLYTRLLAEGPAGPARFYTALRARGIEPTPDPARGVADLYAPNPVLVDGALIPPIVADANAFCDALRTTVSTADALLARAPADARTQFASHEVATQLITDLAHAHPFTSMDVFLVETAHGLDRAYIEWQTVGSYLTLGRWVLAAAAAAWPDLLGERPLGATHNLTLAALSARLRAIYLAGIADDPRQGVVLDYHPHQQVTRREFYAIQALTGGPLHGMGILDPREILYHAGRPHYRRHGQFIPIRRAYARLVYSELRTLAQHATPDEAASMTRFFGDAEHVTWINHPLHFFYGAKIDLPGFYARGLSPALPACQVLDEAAIHALHAQHGARHQLAGWVHKPLDLQGGQSVAADPRVADLRPGWLLQAAIAPAACHLTLAGPRTPEVRVMCLPDEHGRLMAGLLFTRVKAPDVFLSNAGHTAALNVPGTGEGYGVALYA